MLKAYAMRAVESELFGYLMLLFVATKFWTSLDNMQFRKYQGHPNCCRILSYFVYQHLSTLSSV